MQARFEAISADAELGEMVAQDVELRLAGQQPGFLEDIFGDVGTHFTLSAKAPPSQASYAFGKRVGGDVSQPAGKLRLPVDLQIEKQLTHLFEQMHTAAHRQLAAKHEPFQGLTPK